MGIEFVKDERDKKQYDPFDIKNKQDGFEYRLINKHPRNMQRKRYEGYEVVQGNDPEDFTSLDESTPMKRGASVDSTREFQDVVMARIPRELAEKKRQTNKDRIKHLEGSAKAEFKQEAGGTTFDGEGGGGWSGSMSQSEADAVFSGKE